MEERYCWRLTDNRHWDSPARMADGRVFTDWRSSCTMNNALAAKMGVASGVSQRYSEILQATRGAAASRANTEGLVVTGDPWGRAYQPPPPREVIVPMARVGVEVIEQHIPNAIAADVRSSTGDGGVTGRGPLSQGNAPTSDCGRPAMPRNDPRWGLCPETLVLNLRDATAGGGNTTAWMKGTVGDGYGFQDERV